MMMEINNDTIKLEVVLAISKKLRIDAGLIESDTRLSDLKLDSLDLAELLFILEDRLKKTILIRQDDRLETVQDIINLILRLNTDS